MNEEPVDRRLYGDSWIASAWSDSANDALLSSAPIVPRPRVRRAIELLGLAPGLRLLDIACGRGEVPAIAAQLGAEAVGLDYSEASIRFARRVRDAHASASPGTIHLLQSDACQLPLVDASFDRISMLDIVEHLTPVQLERMFREIARVLKPAGYAVVHTLPNRWAYDYGYGFARRFFPKLAKDPRSEYEKKIHVNEQDILGLHRMLASTSISHRIWLEQHIPAQARWSARQSAYNDKRDQVYPLMAGKLGRVLEMLSYTSLRLVLSTDIFAVLWRSDENPDCLPAMPLALTERFAMRLFG